MGLLGIDPELETRIIDIEQTLKEGSLPSEGGIVISESLLNELGLELDDTIMLSSSPLTLQGVLDDAKFQRLTDLDGSPYLPGKLVNVAPEGEPSVFMLYRCEPSEVALLHLSTALQQPLVGISRIDVKVEEEVDPVAFAERLALERGYGAWSSSSEGIYYARVSSYLEGKGLPLMVPWAIVVLNVVITMLNSLYERSKEINILSSVGLNPAQIAAVFVAEVSITGLIAGGLGYLAGLGLYRVMAFLGLALEVHQKVSALWSVASVGLAMTAVLMGAYAALRNSVAITPSLMRRWKIDREGVRFDEPWEITIPVKIRPEELRGFVEFMERSLRKRQKDPLIVTSSISVSGEGTTRTISFVYKSVNSLATNFYTKNTLIMEPAPGDVIGVRMLTNGDPEWARTTGSMVRMIAMEWSTQAHSGRA